MKVIFKKNALEKFDILKKHGLELTKQDIKKIIKKPIRLETKTHYPKFLAEGELGKKRDLCVVYEIDQGRAFVLTFYPVIKNEI